MNIEERLAAAFIGAVWGAFLGFLLALVMFYQVNTSFSSAVLFANWTNVILYSSAVFATIGLIFKASVGTAIAAVMDWLWVLVTRDSERGLLSQHYAWIRLVIIAIFCLGVYLFVKD